MKARIWTSFAILWLALVNAGAVAADLDFGKMAELLVCVNTDTNPATRESIAYTTADLPPASSCNETSGQLRPIYYLHNSVPLSATPPIGITKALIIVHGGTYDPTGMFEAAKNTSNTWVVAPVFFSKNTFTGLPTPPSVDTLRWHNAAGKPEGLYALGSNSATPPDAQVSSFELMDYIIRTMVARTNGRLKEITIFGFSQGARFVNRYSIGTRIDTEKFKDIHFRYVSAAGGGFVYLSDKRYETDETLLPKILPVEKEMTFTDPSSVDPVPPFTCGRTRNKNTYNKYPYGLEVNTAVNPDGHYMNNPSNRPSSFEGNVKNKHRLFLVGEKDAVEDYKETCEEFLQGVDRRNWSFNYVYHLGATGAGENVGLCVIKGVEHNGEHMISSHAAKSYISYGMIDCSLNDETP